MKKQLNFITNSMKNSNSNVSQEGTIVSPDWTIDDAHQNIDPTATTALEHSGLYTSDCYLNRELSWIKFNRRVLSEAGNTRTPLLERVKFLAIVSANIDEFYMKRLGGLKNQIAAGVTRESIDGRSPKIQLEQCRLMLLSLQKEKEAIYQLVLEELGRNDILLCPFSLLDDIEKQALQDYYILNILPLITPLVIDHCHPFPFISNLSLNLIVAMKRHDRSDVLYARVNIPTGDGIPRFVRVGTGDKFVRLEELMIHCLDSLFPCTEIIACDIFRVTRNAITDNDHSDTEHMLEIIARELHDRRFAPVVRLQTGTSMHPLLKHTLVTHLGLDAEKDVLESAVMVCMSDLMEIASLDIPTLRDIPHTPIDNVKLNDVPSIFEAIRSAGTILLQHPYESFGTSVERFVYEASRDVQVATIKMTLYRTSADTKLLEYLINAAQNGKQVSVIIELKARFDEEANICWSTRLEQAGVHVSYGVANLKTHCKTILIVRKEKLGLRRYAHIGTGNYHAGTARLYSDLGLLTCDTQLTGDLTELFNFLTTGCHPQRLYAQILVAPLVIKTALLDKIKREISVHTDDTPGLIRLKTNALEDPDITAALYRASRAGVKVELIVRDICRLRPGVADLSDNIHVVSIVGRFLEHSRIYHFHNAGEEEYYIGSADLMTRNLERRVELLIPVGDREARHTLNEILKTQLSDNCCAWDMQSDGGYVQRQSPEQTGSQNCQESAISSARKRNGVVEQHCVSEPPGSTNKWLRLCF